MVTPGERSRRTRTHRRVHTPDTRVEQVPSCWREHPLGDSLPSCLTHARGAWYTDPRTPCTHAEHASTPTGCSPQTHRTFHGATAGKAGQSTAPPEPLSCLPAPPLHTVSTCLGEGALERRLRRWDRSGVRLSPGLSTLLLRGLRGPFSEVPAAAKSLPARGVLGVSSFSRPGIGVTGCCWEPRSGARLRRRAGLMGGTAGEERFSHQTQPTGKAWGCWTCSDGAD